MGEMQPNFVESLVLILYVFKSNSMLDYVKKAIPATIWKPIIEKKSNNN